MTSMDPLLAPVRPGEILAGRYRVKRVIGVGGMGVVVAAMHQQLEQLVALKFLLPHVLESAEAIARFTREARAAVRIKSEHIARIMDVGTLESGAPYMVMEYLEGLDLAAVLRDRGRLPIPDAVDYILQASEAIAEAHRLGIVHRDLKPANLFLARGDGVESIKVLDFGISKMNSFAASGETASVTQTGTLLGSPMYMSPEQLTSARDVDERTDIWSLGVVLHQLLAGDPPFSGTTVTQVSIAVVQQPAPSLTAIRPDVPPGLAAVVQQSLHKDTAQRFPSIEAFALALAEFGPPHAHASIERIRRIGTGRGSFEPLFPEDIPMPEMSYRSPQNSATPVTHHPTQTDFSTRGEWGGTASKRRARARRREVAFILAAMGLAGAGAAIWFLLGGTPHPLESTASMGGESPALVQSSAAAAELVPSQAAPGVVPSVEPTSPQGQPKRPASTLNIRSAASPPAPIVRPAPARKPAAQPQAASSREAASRPRSPTVDGWENER